jgi:hypothetical protein
MGLKYAEDKPESKKLVDRNLYVNPLVGTPQECSATSTIVFGRLFMAKFLTTFRAAKNGDAMIAIKGVGKTQFKNGGSILFMIFIIILILALIGGVVYGVLWFIKKKKGSSNGGNMSGKYSEAD